MSYIFNSPERFAGEAADGFALAYGTLVRRVAGGVVRRSPLDPGQVAVIIGGGSGHYPAFAGLVGAGIAAGAAMGDVFASPSAHHAYAVARAAEAGGGVLFSYGNYAGDVLNFDDAERRLAADGIACASVPVTDDVASAPPDERHRRRGIAGGLFVYKAAGAKAQDGASLEEVLRVATLANERTRSVGVAFSGCTLPGAREPLFDVPPGRMAIGMGVHGEPGIEERDTMRADELALLLVETVLAERPTGVTASGGQVALVLNGLGGVKYEELFVLYRRVDQILGDEGITVVAPEVGELVTSFAMAGVSLSLCWLNDELERLWRAPALTPAFRRASPAGDLPQAVPSSSSELESPPPVAEARTPDAHARSRAAAALVTQRLRRVADVLAAEREHLGRLDAIAGDGDHGIGMHRGAAAAAAAADAALRLGCGLGTLLEEAGTAWADAGGGTSGALWGIALRRAGASLGDTEAPDSTAALAAVEAACEAIEQAGKASEGDKTMLDALLPFARTLQDQLSAGAALAAAWDRAAQRARDAAEATAALLPRTGRARLHGERSRGTPDPGAVSFALVVEAGGRGGRDEGDV